jgi:hypothetical protein
MDPMPPPTAPPIPASTRPATWLAWSDPARRTCRVRFRAAWSCASVSARGSPGAGVRVVVGRRDLPGGRLHRRQAGRALRLQLLGDRLHLLDRVRDDTLRRLDLVEDHLGSGTCRGHGDLPSSGDARDAVCIPAIPDSAGTATPATGHGGCMPTQRTTRSEQLTENSLNPTPRQVVASGPWLATVGERSASWPPRRA